MNGDNTNLLGALLEATDGYADWVVVRRALRDGRTVHVAVMSEPFLAYVLQGKKTIESRFSKHAIAPFGQIEKGDLVLLKRSGGPVVGCFTAGTITFVQLDRHILSHLQSTYAEAMCADANFWQAQQTKNYATLIEVTDVRTLPTVPLPKKDRRGWVVCRPN